MTETEIALVLVLACAALVCDALRPAQRKRGWNNSRAATQKDVADVLRGGNRSQSEPDTAGLIMFLLVVFALAAFVL